MTVATDPLMPAANPEDEARRKTEARRRYWGSAQERYAPLPAEAVEPPPAVPAPSPAATSAPDPLRRMAADSGSRSSDTAPGSRATAGYWGPSFAEAGVPERPEVSEPNLASRLRAVAPNVSPPAPPRIADLDAPTAAPAAVGRLPGPGSLMGEAVGALVIAVLSGLVAGLTCLVLSDAVWRAAPELARGRAGLLNATYVLVFALMGAVSGLMAPRAWPVAALIGWLPLWASLLAFPELQAGQVPQTRPERLLLVTLWAAPLVATVGALLGSIGSLAPPPKPEA